MAKKKRLNVRAVAKRVLISVVIAINIGGGNVEIEVPINVYVQM